MKLLKGCGSKTTRIIGIDIIRGLACILVILFHYTTRYEELFSPKQSYYITVPYGYIGVSVFFIISGFLTTINIKSSKNIFSFGYKRIIRLYPTYWVSIIITFIVSYFFLPERSISAKAFIVNFTMMQGFFNFPFVDGAHWTLMYEIIFYFIIGSIIMLRKTKNMLNIGLAWQMISLCLSILNSYLDNSLISILYTMTISRYAHMFIVGIAFSSLYRKKAEKLSYITIGLSLINQFINHEFIYLVFYAIIILLFYLILFGGKTDKIFTNKFFLPILFISKISYPLYLIHQNIGYAILKFLNNWIGNIQLLVMVPIIVSVLLAYILHEFVEIPSSKLLLKINPFRKVIS